MMNVNKSVSMVAGVVAFALVATLAVGSLPLVVGLSIAMALLAGLGSVAFSAQSRRFEDEGRFVYQPVYVRTRNVHRRVSSFED